MTVVMDVRTPRVSFNWIGGRGPAGVGAPTSDFGADLVRAVSAAAARQMIGAASKAATDEKFAEVDEAIDLLQAGQGAGHIAFSSWTALAAVTGTLGEVGEVYGDAGTHTDPIVGGTVSNSGVFSYVTGTPHGWKRLGDLGLVTVQVEVDALTPRVGDLEDVAPRALGVPPTVITDSDGYVGLRIEEDGFLTGALQRPVAGERFLWAITDPEGYAAFVIRRDGSIDSQQMRAIGQVQALAGSAFGIVVTDASGWARSVTLADGSPWPAKAEDLIPRTNLPRSRLALLAGITHLISYGQSNSVGAAALPALTTGAITGVKKFVGGVRPFDGGDADDGIYDSLSAFTETDDSPYGETPCGGLARVFVDLLSAENSRTLGGYGQQLLMSAAGTTGVPVSYLMETGAGFARLAEQLAYGYVRAQAAGLTYAPGPLSWTQGEADMDAETDPADYTDGVRKVQRAFQGHAQCLTGMPDQPFPLILSQCSAFRYYHTGPAIALAQAALCEASGEFICAAPTYFLPHNADDVHTTATGKKWLGGYYGRAAKRLLIDGVKFQPLAPIKAWSQGGLVFIKFRVPVAPLVIDTSVVSDPGRYGFDLWDRDGVTSLSSHVTAVALGAPDVVILTTDYDQLPAGATVSYARTTTSPDVGSNGPGAGPTTGARGCLRDSAPEVVDAAGINKPLHNYCVHFDALPLG